MIEVYQFNEPTKLSLCLWLREVIDGLYFLSNKRNTMAINVVSQEVEGVGCKQTFVWVDEDSVG